MAFLLRASLTSPQAEGEALAALLRLGQDLSRGGDLFGATIGSMVRSGAIRLLRFRIADGEYDTNVSAQLIRELDHIRQQPIGVERAVDAEILQLTPALVYRPWIRDRLHAPPRVSRAPTPNNLYEEAAAFHFVLATWSVRAELTAASGHPERLAVYTRNLETYADSYAGFRLLMMTLLETYARYEVDVGSGTEALEIVHLALHARLYRLGTGRWPRSVDDLEGGDVARTSALTGRPFTFKMSNGELIISSDRSNLPAHTIPKPEWDRWSSLTLTPAGDREWVLRD